MRWLQKYSKKIPPSSPRSLAGFSIIELTIILAILSFIVVNALIVSNVDEDLGKVSDTTDQLERLQEALNRHVREFGFYPCPADGRAGIDDASFGESQTGATTTCDSAIDNGSTWGTIGELGIHRLEDTVTGEYAHDNLMVGVIPVKTLGLPSEDAIDPWGNRITYAMLEHMGSVDNFPASINGNITILDSDDANITTTAAYVLISHGPNGVGAWGFEGGANAQRIPSPNPTLWDGDENDNHHLNTENPLAWDKVFTQASAPPANDTGSDIIYDDILVWSAQEHVYKEHYSNNNPANTVANLDLFTPDQIPGLVLWLDAQSTEQDRTTPRFVELNGSTVSAWNDRTSIFNNVTPNNAVQGTASNQPDWITNSMVVPDQDTGIRALGFPDDANKRVLSVASEASINTDSLTVFVAGQTESDNQMEEPVFISKDLWNSGLVTAGAQDGWALGKVFFDNADPTIGYGMFLDAIISAVGTDNFRSYARNGIDPIGGDGIAPLSGGTPDRRHAFIGRIAPDADFFELGDIDYYETCTAHGEDDGTDLAALAPSNPNNIVPGLEGNAASNAHNITIGAYGTSADNDIQGEINEVILYNGALSDYERNEVVDYLHRNNTLLGNCGANTAPVCNAALETLGTACTGNIDCCSGACSGGGTCCVPTSTYDTATDEEHGVNYRTSAAIGSLREKCTQDSDCCNAGAICNAFGYCWLPTIVP